MVSDTPPKQRALVLQGGGALGAYDAGVFQALFDKLSNRSDGGASLFDIVAGTSSGAMNAAILVSNAVEEGWDYAANKLKEFWEYVSTNPYVQNIPGFSMWWDNVHNLDPMAAPGEAARRYYSTKQFLLTGVPNVFLPPPFPKPDTKFFDPLNSWLIYNNQPLKDTLEKFAKFPIATNYSRNQKQPRLLLVSVDVLEGAVVSFDSYPKADGGRRSEYGDYYPADKASGAKNNVGQYEYTINYDEGIVSNHAMASGSVPINYDYAKINADTLTIDSQGNKLAEKVERYFWDGGIASNTPLRELIQAHKDYWLNRNGGDNLTVPDLDVYIVDVWPSKEKNLPIDHDGVIDRNYDLMLCDKTDYDEKVANIVSDYITIANDLIGLAKSKKIPKKEIDDILSRTAKSTHRSGLKRSYSDLIQGRFNINVKRIERTRNVDYDISNKLFDYSRDTIKQLREDGYYDAEKLLNRHDDLIANRH
jgi:NTE family protein